MNSSNPTIYVKLPDGEVVNVQGTVSTTGSGGVTDIQGTITAVQGVVYTSGTIVSSLPSGSNTIGTFTVAYKPDISRKNVVLYVAGGGVRASTTETWATVTTNVDGVESTGQTFYAVSPNKVFRIQVFTASLVDAGRTAVSGNVMVRIGTVHALTSPVYLKAFLAHTGGGTVVSPTLGNIGGYTAIPIPGGIDIQGGTSGVGIGITHLANNLWGTLVATLVGYEY